MGYGFKAVISSSFADIFRNNSLKNGLLPVVVDTKTLQELTSLAQKGSDSLLTIELKEQILVLPDGRKITFPIDDFSKMCLLNGIDQLGYIQKHMSEIESYEKDHPARVNSLL